VGKGTLEYEKYMIWDLIDSQWTGLLHRPTHVTTLFLKPAYAYSCNFDFNGKGMEGLLKCIQRMVPNANAHRTINCEMEMYLEASKLLGCANAIHDRNILMPCNPLIFEILITCFI